MYYVDEVIIVINFEILFVCDFDCIIGMFDSKIKKVEMNEGCICKYLCIICFNFECVDK